MAQQPPHFASSAFFGLLTQKGKETVLKEVAEEAARKFDMYMAAIEEATGIKQLKGEDRRNAYAARGPETWQEMQTRFPQEYSKQMRDWAGLEKASERKVAALYPTSPGDDITKSQDELLSSLRTARNAAANTTPASLPVPTV